jgi:hypothetical protein
MKIKYKGPDTNNKKDYLSTRYDDKDLKNPEPTKTP